MDKPPYIKPSLRAAPSIRGLYWCDFWKDVRLPEMWKKRPVLIVSTKNTLAGVCSVLAISTDPQEEGWSAQWGYKLATPVQKGRDSWVVCNHIYTVATSRLEQVRKNPRLKEEEFNTILAKLFMWLPKLPDA
jgi:mRNA interferase MazF